MTYSDARNDIQNSGAKFVEGKSAYVTIKSAKHVPSGVRDFPVSVEILNQLIGDPEVIMRQIRLFGQRGAVPHQTLRDVFQKKPGLTHGGINDLHELIISFSILAIQHCKTRLNHLGRNL